MLSTIKNNGTHVINILNTRCTTKEVDTLMSTSYNKPKTGNLLHQKINTSGNDVILGSLKTNVCRCGEITFSNDDDLNALRNTNTINSKCIYN